MKKLLIPIMMTFFSLSFGQYDDAGAPQPVPVPLQMNALGDDVGALSSSSQASSSEVVVTPFTQDSDYPNTNLYNRWEVGTTNACGADGLSSCPTQYFDVGISLWREAPVGVRDEYIKIVKYWAKGVYESTNGAHKLREITFFQNQAPDENARIIWSERRKPFSHIAGWGKNNKKIYVADVSVVKGTGGVDEDVDNFADNRALEKMGYQLAHHWANYTYGLTDQLKGAEAYIPTKPWQAHADDDATAVTIMNKTDLVFDDVDDDARDYSYLNFDANTVGSPSAQARVYPNRNSWDILQLPGATQFAPVWGDIENVNDVTVVLWSALQNTDRRPLVSEGFKRITTTEDDAFDGPWSDQLSIVWKSKDLALEIIIDKSGSMRNGRLDEAKTAALTFINSLPIEHSSIGVLAFNDNMDEVSGVTNIAVDDDKDPLRLGVGALLHGGGTALYTAALAGHTELDGYGPGGDEPVKYSVLLTDGRNEPPTGNTDTETEVIAAYLGSKIPLYTIGFAAHADVTTLGNMSDGTNATFYDKTGGPGDVGKTLAEIYDEIYVDVQNLQQISEEMHFEDGFSQFDVLNADQMDFFTVVLEQNCEGTAIPIEFTNPNGDIATAYDFSIDPLASPIKQTYTFHKSQYPIPFFIHYQGKWSLQAPGTCSGSNISYIVQAYQEVVVEEEIVSQTVGDPTNADVDYTIEWPNTLYFTTTVSNAPSGTDITAVVDITEEPGAAISTFGIEAYSLASAPAIQTQTQVVLNDRGVDGDMYAGDGIFTASWNDYTGNGNFTAKTTVNFETPDGSTGIIYKESSFEVVGYVADGNDEFSNATPINADNSKNSDRIEDNSDVDYFTVENINREEDLYIRLKFVSDKFEPSIKIFNNSQSLIKTFNKLEDCTLVGGYPLVVIPAADLVDGIVIEVTNTLKDVGSDEYDIQVGEALEGETGTMICPVRDETMISGTFTIQNINSDKCVDVYHAKVEDAANVQQWDCNNTHAQQWEIVPIGVGEYVLRNVNSGRLLDVAWGGTSENVQQWGIEITSDSQKWTITDLGEDVFSLSPLSDLAECLDVQAASHSAGANIQSYTCNGTDAQKFRLLEKTTSVDVLSGSYKIINNGSNKCVDVTSAQTWDGVNVQQWVCNGTNAQSWDFHSIGSNIYEIRNVNSGRLLDVAWGGQDSNVQQWGTRATGPHQQWFVEQGTNGTFTLKPVHDYNECLDIAGASQNDGANIQSVWCNQSSAQKFMIVK